MKTSVRPRVFPPGVLAATLACAAALAIPHPVHAQSGNFGTETPSVNQIIDQLKSGGSDDATAGVRTRALRPGASSQATAMPEAAPAPAAPAAISMQIQFAFGSDQIAESSRRSIDNLAAALASSELKGRMFTVAGHTDGVGSADYNMRLSQRRAASVKTYLVGHGVDASRLRTVGKGQTELLNPVDPRAAENRRVEIIATGS
ncbi:MAG: OmpA family protein [Alcaligenaceae bacterium]|nr:OmpA family protein [Alcaligenaceae bacterium SAGV5]MPS50939.1 OmpA family protein [Alcaligenaceae bacterium SAGV3]MPT55756.1 OmpA family protein [Alcaligenaceae bacterium]